MFSSMIRPGGFQLAARLGATINLDDFTHIDFLKGTIGAIPKPSPAATTRQLCFSIRGK